MRNPKVFDRITQRLRSRLHDKYVNFMHINIEFRKEIDVTYLIDQIV